jgi:ribosome maturation factor RimP
MEQVQALIERIREIAARVAASEGFDLVDVELHGRGPGAVLRIYLDKPGGITLDDCQNVSRQVGTILDVEGLIAARYTLEVSSPGFDRKLSKAADFKRFTGNKVKLQLRNLEGGRKRFQGLLLGIESGRIRMQVEPAETIEIPLEAIERANLVPDFRELLGGKKKELNPRSKRQR